jgi:hypothetical protein
VDTRIARRVLTTGNGSADFISNLDIDFEIWSELYDLSSIVTPDVSTLRGEVLVG